MPRNAVDGDKISRRPTLIDIAKRANVSTWTVSHALRGGTAVGEETRTRVLQIASELGYRPNQAARALVSARTQLVAIWVASRVGEFSSYYARLQCFLQARAREHGYRCIIEDFVGDEDSGADPTALLDWNVDGMILCDVPPQAARELADPGGRLPLVSIGSWGVDTSIDHVGIDLYPGSVDAVRHLLAAGCDRIAYVTPLSLDARFDAYAGVVREAGRREECIVVAHNDRASVMASLRSHAARRGMPGGLFCHNDECAIACYRALCEMGVRVPEEVCIVGCDGIEETEYLPARISTIVTPLKDIAAAAWTFLAHRIQDPTIPQQRLIVTPRFVARDSSSR